MQRPDSPEELLTPDEVAKMLKVKRKQVYKLIHDEGLPARRLNRRTYRVPATELLAWLEARPAASVVASAKRS